MYNGGIFLSYMLVLRLWQMLTLVKEYHKKPFNYTIYYPKTICYIKHCMLKYHHEFFFFFERELQPMTSIPNDNFLSSNQDTNEFLV